MREGERREVEKGSLKTEAGRCLHEGRKELANLEQEKRVE